MSAALLSSLIALVAGVFVAVKVSEFDISRAIEVCPDAVGVFAISMYSGVVLLMLAKVVEEYVYPLMEWKKQQRQKYEQLNKIIED